MLFISFCSSKFLLLLIVKDANSDECIVFVHPYKRAQVLFAFLNAARLFKDTCRFFNNMHL